MVHLESIIAISVGLLASTMTPCLIQLVFFYFAAISGVSASEAWEGELSQSELRTYKRKLVVLTGIFSLGVMTVMVFSGALVGWFGSEIRNVPLWSGDAIWAQRVAGVAFLGMGIWMANITRAPVVCKIPFPSIRRNPAEMSTPMLFGAGFVFMFGCATCFSGAIFASMLAYIGTTAAPVQGALIMFFFSLGVVIPLMVSSLLLSRVYPYLTRMEKASRYMGLVSSLFIIGFGVLAVTGQFHTVSDLIWNVLFGG
jgi:cytochrome c-type biogenesis protein